MQARVDVKETQIMKDYHPAIKNAFSLPIEMITLLFSYLSPKQLADVSLVDRQWHTIAKTFPRLTNIQTAFFQDKKRVSGKRLKDLFEKIIHCDFHSEFNISTLKDLINKTKKLIKEGAVDINSTNVPMLPFLIHYYIVAMIHLELNPDSDLSAMAADCFRDLILFLLEKGMDINQRVSSRFLSEQRLPTINTKNRPFSGHHVERLEGKTALEYADQRAIDYPGMGISALLNEYNKFNKTISM